MMTHIYNVETTDTHSTWTPLYWDDSLLEFSNEAAAHYFLADAIKIGALTEGNIVVNDGRLDDRSPRIDATNLTVKKKGNEYYLEERD